MFVFISPTLFKLKSVSSLSKLPYFNVKSWSSANEDDFVFEQETNIKIEAAEIAAQKKLQIFRIQHKRINTLALCVNRVKKNTKIS
jgi:hypothetical protein